MTIRKMLLATTFLAAMMATASAAPKHIQNIECEGALTAAHTITVGNCSFTGPSAKKVYARCKTDNLCYVDGRGWNNHAGMFIIEHVIAVQKMPANTGD